MRVIEGGNEDRPIKIWASEVETEAEMQVRRLAKLPFVFKHVAVMPDVHAGKGSTIGTVFATKGAIIPSAVGVDIGCGMAAVKLPFDMNLLNAKVGLRDLRHSIERSIPTGFHERAQADFEADNLMWNFLGLPAPESLKTRARNQLGTLGGGNHFVEICEDKQGGAWVMLHSGSRNIGKVIADWHINEAKELMKKYFISLPDPELAYLAHGTGEFQAYVRDLQWAQTYARKNREVMMRHILKDISHAVFGEANGEALLAQSECVVNCHHNYVAVENHFGSNVFVTRKGAVSAKAGELGIIPGSMGTKSYIVRGKGNPDSFHSCSHGAGRRMSRTKARDTFTQEDLIAQTSGVECRKDAAVIDEIPAAYKDIDQVMADQADLVDVVYELKQVICVKGA